MVFVGYPRKRSYHKEIGLIGKGEVIWQGVDLKGELNSLSKQSLRVKE